MTGIPFPQTRDRSGGDTSPTDHVYHQASAEVTQGGGTVDPRFAIPVAPATQHGEHAQIDEQEQQQRHRQTSQSSRPSVRGGESLPSIRNLLSSISSNGGGGNGGSSGMLDDASSFASRSSSPPYQRRRQATETAIPYNSPSSREHPHNAAVPSSQSWDARMSVRSSSPTKRPPLAPSAYAHSHYAVGLAPGRSADGFTATGAYVNPAPHRLTGSMPSLSSSVSTASVGSMRERGRVHSLEEQYDLNQQARQQQQGPQTQYQHQSAPPSSWHGVPPQRSGSSETFNSPQSSVWHSRSSTLESIETSSSGPTSGSSFQHHTSHRHAHSQDSTTDHTDREDPTTPKHNRSDYNRDWRFPQHRHHQQQQQQNQRMLDAQQQQQHQQMMRTRHGSLSSLSSTAYREHAASYGPASAGHLPASPFASMSLESPPANAHLHSRPRAQTMTYHDRQIAPLPSHGMHAQMASGVPRSIEYDGAMQHRSFSSNSTQSLPGRVSSMAIDAASSSRSPAAGTVIVNAHSGVSVGSGGAGAPKYECGWCGKRFSRPSSLKIHHHSHTGEKPFVCSEAGCGRTFSVQSNLRRHQKSHAANARKLAASGESGTHVGMFAGGSSRVAPASDMHFRTSSPSNGAGSNESHAHAPQDTMRGYAPKASDRFNSLRERKTSVSSSTAGDAEEEDEDFDDELDEDDEDTVQSIGGGYGQTSSSSSTSLASPFGRSSKRMYAVDNADLMQDIREEAVSLSSLGERPTTAGSVRRRFQGLLNPGGGQPS